MGVSIVRFKNTCCAVLRMHTQMQLKCYSINVKNEWQQRRNIIFDEEFEKQRTDVGRIEKITVTYLQIEEGKELQMAMNKDLSTPNDCARHVSEFIHKGGALALVDDEPWDMHKPLVSDCKLRILSMQMPKLSTALNLAFWRTGSLMLGAMIDSSFKDEVPVFMHSFPWPNFRSGSFVCDAVLDVPDWKPTDAELRAMSAQFVKFATRELPIERLQVSEKIALMMYQDNPYKTSQIPNIASNQDGKVTVYRIDKHIDISKGPMVGNTGIFGRCTVTAVNKIKSDQVDNLYRFQGVALPKGVFLNHFAYGILEDRARKMNMTGLMPLKESEETPDSEAEFNVAQN